MTHTYTTPILCKEFCFDNRSGLLFRNIICCITQKDMVLCKAGHEFLFFYFHKLVFYLQQRSYVFKLTQTCNVCKKKKPTQIILENTSLGTLGPFSVINFKGKHVLLI